MSDGGRVWIWQRNFDGAIERLIYFQEKEQQDILLHKVRIECRICMRPALYEWTLQNMQGLFHPVHQVVHWQIEEAVFLVPPVGLNII